jgi:AmiR/NasT family two-component response regulator
MEKRRVLIAEGQAIISMDIESTVQAMGHQVVGSTNNINDLFEKAERLKPNLIVLDVWLQGDVNGIETADIIRNHFNIPVVLLITDLEQSKLNQLKQTNLRYVVKPIKESELRTVINKTLFVGKAEVDFTKKIA